MENPLRPGDTYIAKVKDEDRLLILSGDRRRSVTVECAGVAELLGVPRNHLKMGQVRQVAGELLRNPRLAYGRFEMCEEMHDADRDEPHPWVYRPDEWKGENGG